MGRMNMKKKIALVAIIASLSIQALYPERIIAANRYDVITATSMTAVKLFDDTENSQTATQILNSEIEQNIKQDLGQNVSSGTSVQEDLDGLQQRMKNLGTNFLDNATSCQMNSIDGTIQNVILPMNVVRYEVFYTSTANAPAFKITLGDGTVANSILLGNSSDTTAPFSWVYKTVGKMQGYENIYVATLYIYNYQNTMANIQIALDETTTEFIMTQTKFPEGQTIENSIMSEAETLCEPVGVCAWFLKSKADAVQNQISTFSNASSLWQMAATGFIVDDSKIAYKKTDPEPPKDNSKQVILIGGIAIIVLLAMAVGLIYLAGKKKNKEEKEVKRIKREKQKNVLNQKRQKEDDDVNSAYNKYADEYKDDDYLDEEQSEDSEANSYIYNDYNDEYIDYDDISNTDTFDEEDIDKNNDGDILQEYEDNDGNVKNIKALKSEKQPDKDNRAVAVAESIELSVNDVRTSNKDVVLKDNCNVVKTNSLDDVNIKDDVYIQNKKANATVHMSSTRKMPISKSNIPHAEAVRPVNVKKNIQNRPGIARPGTVRPGRHLTKG